MEIDSAIMWPAANVVVWSIFKQKHDVLDMESLVSSDTICLQTSGDVIWVEQNEIQKNRIGFTDETCAEKKWEGINVPNGKQEGT